MLLFILAYWLYVVAKLALANHARLRDRYYTRGAQLLRSLFLILGTTLFLAALYFRTDYLSRTGERDELWLLFVFANFTTSQYGSTKQLLTTLLLSSIALTILLSFTTTAILSIAFLSDLATKLCILWLLSFILHYLIKLISDSLASMQLVQSVTEKLRCYSSEMNEALFLQKVVEEISHSFGYPHVNIFKEVEPGLVRCVAAASEDGQRLIAEDFTLPNNERSIIRHVLYEMEEDSPVYLSSNVRRDGYYLQHQKVFQNTKTELAAKISVKQESFGILDVQAEHSSSIFDHDKAIFVALAKLIGNELETMGVVNLTQQERNTLETIASKFLPLQDLQTILHEIAKTSQRLFRADACALYIRDYKTGGLVLDRCISDCAVDLRALQDAAYSATRLVEKHLANEGSFSWYSSFDKTKSLREIFRPTKRETEHLLETARKENIKALAIAGFQGESGTMGALVLTYGKKLEDSGEISSRLEGFIQTAFLNLAARAIERAQLHERQTQRERERLRVLLHDNLISHLHMVDQLLIESTRCEVQDYYRYVDTALNQLGQAMETVKFLEMSAGVQLSSTLSENVKQLEEIFEMFNVKTNIKYDKALDGISSFLAFEVSSILFEAAVNAIRHSSLTEFNMDCLLEKKYIKLIIKDNGGGAPNQDFAGVEYSIRNRVETLKGICKVFPHQEGGFTIDIRLPLQARGEAAHG